MVHMVYVQNINVEVKENEVEVDWSKWLRDMKHTIVVIGVSCHITVCLLHFVVFHLHFLETDHYRNKIHRGPQMKKMHS